MRQYLDLLETILNNGNKKEDRTGTGTLSIFGHQLRCDLNEGFPLLTTKKIHFKSIVYELLWFLKGETNIAFLKENNIRIWDEWADADGNLGPIYGKQWRSWGASDGQHIDQINMLMSNLRKNPDSRRHIVSAWNVGEIDKMNLPPCHILFQFYVHDNKLSCQLYQRSADVFLGVPFNIASYSLLTMMIAKQLNLEVGEFIHTFGDAHLYLDHIEQCKIQLLRTPKPLPSLDIDDSVKSLFDYQFEDFSLRNYDADDHIPAKVSV